MLIRTSFTSILGAYALVCASGCIEPPTTPLDGGPPADAGEPRACIIRIDARSTATSPDGFSWEQAFASFEVGIRYAHEYQQSQPRVPGSVRGWSYVPSCEVWVAGGTYDVRELFQLEYEMNGSIRTLGFESLQLFGGFAGDETAREQRDFERYETVFDGGGAARMLSMDDGPIDGITFRNGGVCLDVHPDSGSSGPTVENSTFEDCDVGVAVRESIIRNCTFLRNWVGVRSSGGDDDYARVTGSLFRENAMALQYGGTAYGSTFVLNGQAGGFGASRSLYWGNESVNQWFPGTADGHCNHCTVFGTGGRGEPLGEDNLNHSIYWGNDPTTLTAGNPAERGLSLVQSELLRPDGENISGDPLFVNAPRGWGRTVEGTSDSVAVLHDATDFAVGDVIEILDDGIARTVTAIDGASVTFTPPFVGLAPRTFVATWGPGATDLTEDFHLRHGSPAIDAGEWLGHDGASGYCDLGAFEWIRPPSCENAMLDEGEADIDCGGAACGPCDDGRSCTDDAHCRNGRCLANVCASCDDGLLDGYETDVDCGGPECDDCPDGRVCAVAEDCGGLYATCEAGLCVSCSDRMQNRTETDVDCGGERCYRCRHTQMCLVDTDCDGANCEANVCAPP